MNEKRFLWPTRVEKFIGSAVLCAIILFGILVAAVFITESTFGQRCGKEHQHYQSLWHECVHELSSN